MLGAPLSALTVAQKHLIVGTQSRDFGANPIKYLQSGCQPGFWAKVQVSRIVTKRYARCVETF
jgi:hypothetical protein